MDLDEEIHSDKLDQTDTNFTLVKKIEKELSQLKEAAFNDRKMFQEEIQNLKQELTCRISTLEDSNELRSKLTKKTQKLRKEKKELQNQVTILTKKCQKLENHNKILRVKVKELLGEQVINNINSNIYNHENNNNQNEKSFSTNQINEKCNFSNYNLGIDSFVQIVEERIINEPKKKKRKKEKKKKKTTRRLRKIGTLRFKKKKALKKSKSNINIKKHRKSASFFLKNNSSLSNVDKRKSWSHKFQLNFTQKECKIGNENYDL
ncbi:bzip transcription factor [Anaeramoeba flamelloides]|uniref:Bzip transcription factor n=1 Tax=Anaeramoeba flamelloides TaxID=1746091 RepID=A0AAV7YA53_9EUKA|nr:bzip transcription factor [Anaeramoeba flamelloides]